VNRKLAPIKKGDASENRVFQKLVAMGFRDVRMNRRKRPYDMQVDGFPVEIKYATPLKRYPGRWSFYIGEYRDGLAYPALAYVLCMDEVPGESDWVFLVVPGPLVPGRLIVWNEPELFPLRWGRYRDNWTALQPNPYPLIPRPLPNQLLAGGFGLLSISDIPRFIEYYSAIVGWTIEEFALRIALPVEEIERVIEGIIPPSPALIYALGARMD
jgi:hypothetical protein